MSEVFTTVILPVLGTALLGLAGFLGTQLQAAWKRVATDKTKKKVAETCVKAVEQLYKDLDGEKKKQKAIDNITKMLAEKGIKITKLEIEMLLEAAVAEFNRQRTADATQTVPTE